MIKKVLLTLWLIWIWLVNFSFWDYTIYNVNTEYNICGRNGANCFDFHVDENSNFTSTAWNYIRSQVMHFNWFWNLGWIDWKFAFIWQSNQNNRCPWDQGYYIYVCKTDTNYENCTDYRTYSVNDFYNDSSLAWNLSYIAFDNSNVGSYSWWIHLCFVYESLDKSYCFLWQIREYMWQPYYYDDTMFFTWTCGSADNETDFINLWLSDWLSPFNWGGSSDVIPENWFPNTNRGVFDSYAEEWYVLKWCYSDFALNDLATSTWWIYQFYETNLDDWVYYTWATVLDLFVEYGYWNSFESFFDYWYNTYSQSLKTDSPSKYVWLSKWLWNMSNKYYYAWLSNKYVDYTKLYNYCSYFVDFDWDWDWDYIWPEIPSDVANNLSQSSSAIEYLSWFIHNQLSSWNGQNFDADSFFNTLTTKFDRLLNNINWSYVWLIPWYILAIMMALIFIRIISH